MNTKKFFYGILAFLVLFAAACTSSSADEDQLYEVGVDKTKIRLPNKEGVDKTKIRLPNKESVDKTKIRLLKNK